jgi:hypothetical protein
VRKSSHLVMETRVECNNSWRKRKNQGSMEKEENLSREKGSLTVSKKENRSKVFRKSSQPP